MPKTPIGTDRSFRSRKRGLSRRTKMPPACRCRRRFSPAWCGRWKIRPPGLSRPTSWISAAASKSRCRISARSKAFTPTGPRSATGPGFFRKISTKATPGSFGTCWCGDCGDAAIPSFRQIIERHRPKTQRQIRLEMQRGDHLAHRQPRDVGERVREQAEGGGAGPGLLQRDVLKREAHQFADPGGAVDMRNDLENEIRRLHALEHGVMIDRAVLVAHGGGGAEH